MCGSINVTLPTGIWKDELLERDARLRPLRGIEESRLLEQRETHSVAELVTTLLQSCLLNLGSLKPVSRDAVRSLTIGDREALLIHIRRLTFGDSVHGILTCPGEGCGEKIDAKFRIGDLLVPPYRDPRRTYETCLDADGANCYVTFRLPTGADQENAVCGQGDVDQAIAGIVARCVQRTTSNEVEMKTETLGPPAIRQLSAMMSEMDPQAELRLVLICPVCDSKFSIIFDTANFLFRELLFQPRDLYAQVHQIATRYHWSEDDILGLPTGKRWMYLGLIENER